MTGCAVRWWELAKRILCYVDSRKWEVYRLWQYEHAIGKLVASIAEIPAWLETAYSYWSPTQ
jgi:hypothetical protein